MIKSKPLNILLYDVQCIFYQNHCMLGILACYDNLHRKYAWGSDAKCVLWKRIPMCIMNLIVYLVLPILLI